MTSKHRRLANRSKFRLSIPIVSSLLVLFAIGGIIANPSARIAPLNGSKEVSPGDGLKMSPLFGTKITRLEVSANQNLIPARFEDGRVLLNGSVKLEPDTFYRIRLWLRGFTGRRAYREFSFTTAATPMPILTADEVLVRFDEEIPIRWNIPVKGFRYELPPGVESRLALDKSRQIGLIRILNYQQGQRLHLRIIDAVGVNGQRMRQGNPGYVQRVATTSPLRIDIDPAYGQRGQNRSREIIITFSENIINPKVAEDSFSIEPRIAGGLSWIQPNQLKFSPIGSWDYETEVHIRLKKGPHGARGVGGGFVEGDFESFFVTIPYKLIDVNLSTQSLVAYEAGQPVFSCLLSSGKPGYDTPTGEFRIYAKQRFADMENTPDMPERYFVKDVPFVNWIRSSVAIHGVYWHSNFGNVMSHGCIGVSVSNAAWIYNWAPVGTPVIVHY